MVWHCPREPAGQPGDTLHSLRSVGMTVPFWERYWGCHSSAVPSFSCGPSKLRPLRDGASNRRTEISLPRRGRACSSRSPCLTTFPIRSGQGDRSLSCHPRFPTTNISLARQRSVPVVPCAPTFHFKSNWQIGFDRNHSFFIIQHSSFIKKTRKPFGSRVFFSRANNVRPYIMRDIVQ